MRAPVVPSLRGRHRARHAGAPDRRRHRRPSFPRREALAAVVRLADLTSAGIASGDALAASARRGGPLLRALHASVQRGSSLSIAMRSLPGVFDEADVALVRAGEQGGSTARALALLAERMQKRSAGSRRLAGALAYPVLLVAGAGAALGFLSIVVLPSFTSLYAGQDVPLPLSTRVLLAAGRHCSEWGPALLAAAPLLTATAVAARTGSRSARRLLDRVALELPGLRSFAAPARVHDSAALIAALLEAGCEAEEALGLASRASPNLVVAARLRAVLRSLRRGVPLSRAWTGAGMDPGGAGGPLLEVAEATGGYPRAFARIAAAEGAAADRALDRVCRVAEPAAVVVMAVAVGGGVLALYQPMLGSASLLLGGTP